MTHWTVEHLMQIAAGEEMSVRELERLAKVSPNTIDRWKRDDRVPHLEALDKALNVLGYRVMIAPLKQITPG